MAEESTSHKGTNIKSYTLAFKVSNLDYFHNGHTKEATAKHAGVDTKRIRDWVKNEDKLRLALDNEAHGKKSKRRKLPGGGRKPMSETLELELVEYIEELRSNNLRVTTKMVQNKAKDLFEDEQVMEEAGKDSFSASKGWLYNFFRRHSITVRKKTSVAQKMPEQVQPKLVRYILYLRALRIKHKYDLSSIGAMDETPIWMDMAGDYTLDKVGTRTVTVKSTGHDKARVTVCLAAKANGAKLAPFVVFKGVRKDKQLETIEGVVCVMSRNGWMSEELTLIWLEKVWGRLAFSRRLLCWDAFRCHIMDSMKKEVAKLRTDMAVIPGGCTGIIQAPDVSWNKPFKAHYRELYEAWFRSDKVEYTKGGNPRAPSKYLVASWVKEAWEKVPKEIVIKSFKVCGVTNALDGSENDEILCLREGEVAHPCRGEILEKGSKLVQNGGDLTGILNDVEELGAPSMEDQEAENGLAVSDDDAE